MFIGMRTDLLQSLHSLNEEEVALNAELNECIFNPSYYGMFDTAELSNNVKTIEEFSPYFEAMAEDSKKLGAVVDNCHVLSDRISVIVRRLDGMQIRAHHALACTEDIISLKESKVQLEQAIGESNLSLCVRLIQQVRKIGEEAASTSVDYNEILKQEKMVKDMVQSEFNAAIAANNLSDVMSLCPLLQSLDLEASARDQFLDFVAENVFIAVTADGASAGESTDPATAYAHSLASIFNASYLILQKYLPMVIQGMETSYGDVHFLRRLHKKCEEEASSVLKRYLKFRNVKSLIVEIKSIGVDVTLRSNALSTKGGQNVDAGDDSSVATNETEIHVVLDELALLIQYCSLYSKYIHRLCVGAIDRPRDTIENKKDKQGKNESNKETAREIFPGPINFDKMVDELINNYYMEAERWLMHRSVKYCCRALQSGDGDKDGAADECFYVLQRCGLRAIASNNIHAACAVLHFISDLLSSELLVSLQSALSNATETITIALLTKVSSYVKLSRKTYGGGNNTAVGGLSTLSEDDDDDEFQFGKDTDFGLNLDKLDKTLLRGYNSALSLMAGTENREKYINNEYSERIQEGIRVENDDGVFGVDEYGTDESIDVFNLAEKLSRFTQRLSTEVLSSGETVFGIFIPPSNSSSGGFAKKKISNKKVEVKETDKLWLCKSDFENTFKSYSIALNNEFERLGYSCNKLLKDALTGLLGPKGPLGGVRFDFADNEFDNQPSIALLPGSIVTPVELMAKICVKELSDSNRFIMLHLLAEATCERIEHYITQTSFRFAGALKFEECVRAIISMLTKISSQYSIGSTAHNGASFRGKFSRLRELMLVLTSDVRGGAASNFADSLSQLTLTEAQTIISLRLDAHS